MVWAATETQLGLHLEVCSINCYLPPSFLQSPNSAPNQGTLAHCSNFPGSGGRVTWVQDLALALPSCVILGKYFSCQGLDFLICKKGHNRI